MATTRTVTPTFTKTPKPTVTQTQTPIPTSTSTKVPLGTYALYSYSPLVLSYDPSIWEDKSNYSEWGDKSNPPPNIIIRSGLQMKSAGSCVFGEQGPTDFNGPHTSKFVQLGNVKYEVLSFPSSSQDEISKAYIADQSLSTNWGLPVFWVSAKPNEWDKCKPLAEKVLSTLRFPP